jgi:aspartyl protease family protein
MVDTGATVVGMSFADASRIGLNLRGARQGVVSTANGLVRAVSVMLETVRVGDVEVHDVEALISPEPMPFVLLGNSVLSRFQMRRDNDVMRLVLRAN